MKLYADSANLDEVSPLLENKLIAGVTSNPTIMSRDGHRSGDREMLYRELVRAGAQEVFLQAVGGDEAILHADALGLAALGERIVVKVPATEIGFRVAARLASGSTPVLVTAVYGVSQAIYCASIGVRYIAPYFGRMIDSGIDALERIERMDSSLIGSATSTLVASVRSAESVEQLSSIGIRHITASVPVLSAMMQNDASDAAAAEFERIAAARASGR